MTSKEVWKDIPGYEGRYQASSLGRIRSLDHYSEYVVRTTSADKHETVRKHFHKGQVLRGYPISKGKGYLQLRLSDPNGKHKARVHELIALTFLGPKPPGAQIRHLNGDDSDNRIENLSYGTYTDNRIDDLKNNATRAAKLTVSDVLKIRDMLQTTDLPLPTIAKEFNVSPGCISNIAKGRTWWWL